MLHNVRALWATEEMERSKKVHNFSVFTYIDKDKRDHFQKNSVHVCLVWRESVLFSSPSKRGGGLDSREGLKGEAQNNFSRVLTVPLIVIVFILVLGKSW